MIGNMIAYRKQLIVYIGPKFISLPKIERKCHALNLIAKPLGFGIGDGEDLRPRPRPLGR